MAVDLNAHIAEMQKMIGRLIGEHIVLSTELSPSVGRVKADPGAHRTGGDESGRQRPRRHAARRDSLPSERRASRRDDRDYRKFPRVPRDATCCFR